MQTSAPRIVGPQDGKAGTLGSIGVRFMINGEDTHEGGFSLVEHPMPPRHLAAPLHRHTREDEYSYVLEGKMGALLGEEVVYAEAGDLVFKPRNQWHTFWNAGDEPCRILEIIRSVRVRALLRRAGRHAGPGTTRLRGHRQDCRSLRTRCKAGKHPRAVRALRSHIRSAAVRRPE